MKLKVIRANDSNNSKRPSIEFWSNCCGDLHYHGKYDIEEEDLPDELKRAYYELWGEDYGSLCYLVETDEGYGIALIDEYDGFTAEKADVSMDELFDLLVSDAFHVAESKKFESATVYAMEYSGFLECHELVVVFPANIEKETFQNAADALYKEYSYQSISRRKFNMNTDKFFEEIKNKKTELSEKYEVPVTSIVYVGDDKFVVVKNGVEIVCNQV